MTQPTLAELAARGAVRGAARMDAQSLHEMLPALAGWQLAQEALEKTFRFAAYPETLQFVNAVAWIAQRLDHHPDLEVRYNRCRVVWTTHDAQGVTINDCIAAARTEQLFA